MLKKLFPAQDTAAAAPALTRREQAEVAAFFVVLLAACLIPAAAVSIAAVVLLVTFAVRKDALAAWRSRISLPAVGLAGLLLMYIIACLYAPDKAPALPELFRGLCALTAALVALFRFRKKHILALLWGFVSVAAVISFLCVDAASVRWIAAPLTACGLLDTQFFGNPHALAGLSALAILVGLYQLRTGTTRRDRAAAGFLLGVNAVGFGFCRSLSAIVCLLIALILFVLLVKKGRRIRFFTMLVFTLILSIVFTAVGLLLRGTAFALLCALACGPVIFLAEEFISGRVLETFEEMNKEVTALLRVSGGMWVALIVFFFAAAFMMDYAYTFEGSEVITRTMKLDEGTYSCEANMDEGVAFTVAVIEKGEEANAAAWDVVYDSAADSGSFSVPADARVRVCITGAPESTIRALSFSDGTTVPLNYPLLPDTVSHNLQSGRLRSWLALRGQYIRDAVTVWAASPVFGSGLAATEALYPDVQPFPYESGHVHNHLVQYLADLGLIGLALFLLLAVSLVVLLVRKRRKAQDTLSAMLLSCFAMMHLHSLVEMNFSLRGYVIPAFFLMAVAAVYCAVPLRKGAAEKTAEPAQ